ncbi:MAG: hypothetical protein ACE5HX_18515 [bacterium]
MIENVIKILLVSLLLIAGFLYWLLPKTKFVKHCKMNETLFVFTCVIGIICGVIGLLVTFVWPQFIVELHLWELIIMPFVLIWIYWGMIIRVRKTTEIIDEKQNLDMTRAAATTWIISIPALAFMFILYEESIMAGTVWFPYFFFMSLFVFSLSLLFFFRKT